MRFKGEKVLIKATCLEKIKDNNGNIYEYRLYIDGENSIRLISARDLKKAIRQKQLIINNLKLTSDNRLIDKKKIIDKRIIDKRITDKAFVKGIQSSVWSEFKDYDYNKINYDVHYLKLDDNEIEYEIILDTKHNYKNKIWDYIQLGLFINNSKRENNCIIVVRIGCNEDIHDYFHARAEITVSIHSGNDLKEIQSMLKLFISRIKKLAKSLEKTGSIPSDATTEGVNVLYYKGNKINLIDMHEYLNRR